MWFARYPSHNAKAWFTHGEEAATSPVPLLSSPLDVDELGGSVSLLEEGRWYTLPLFALEGKGQGT